VQRLQVRVSFNSTPYICSVISIEMYKAFAVN